jgi:hypothetical protein
MDRVTFEIAPLNERIRGAAVLVAAIVLMLVALTSAPWYTARIGDETLALRMFKVVDAPELTSYPSTLGHTLGAIAMMLFSLNVFVRLIFMVITIVYGSPLVKRGLFSSKLKVAWKSSLRAQIWTGVLTVLAVYTALDIPTLGVTGSSEQLAATITHSWGGVLFVIACVVTHVGLYLIARHPLLAQSQTWELPASEQPPRAPAPVRASRPMIKSPLPPAPNVATDPFRSPPRAPSLEDKLVRPALPTQSPAVVARENADEPSLLR